jgi:anti-sigma regulatory factor (Ser/Thr protein kinase)
VIIGGWRGPGWRVVDAHPGHVRQVRDWISAAITRHDCPVDPADAALAVSELFTNAVIHGPREGRVLVGYCLWSQGARIVVCDGGGSGTPELRQVTSQAEGGRGLHVVDSVTARWGSFRLAGNLVTWCDFGQPLRAPASDAWAWLHCVLSADTHLLVPAWQRAEPESANIGLLIPVSVVRPSVTASPAAPQPSTRTSPPAAVQDAPLCGRAWPSRVSCSPAAPVSPLPAAARTGGD